MQTYVFEKEEIGGFAEILQKYRSKTDIVKPVSQVFMREDGTLVSGEMATMSGEDTRFIAKPTNWALTQIGEFTGIHANYLTKMRENHAIDLMAENINYWFSRGREKRLFRVFEGDLIGFLSDRYQAIDNFDIVSHALSAARTVAEGQNTEIQILRPYLTETTMSVTLLTTDFVYLEDGNEAEKYRMGLHIRNSEVGKAAFSMRPLLLRTSCMNSNIFKGYDEDVFRRTHLGKKLSVGNIWSNDTHLLESATIRSQIKDVTKAAFSKEIAMGRVQNMRHLKDEAFTPLPERVEATRRILGLSQQESDAIWGKVIQNNRYEFLQAITNHAQSYYNKDSNPERETELEELGGSLASGKALWEAIERETERATRKKA